MLITAKQAKEKVCNLDTKKKQRRVYKERQLSIFNEINQAVNDGMRGCYFLDRLSTREWNLLKRLGYHLYELKEDSNPFSVATTVKTLIAWGIEEPEYVDTKFVNKQKTPNNLISEKIRRKIVNEEW